MRIRMYQATDGDCLLVESSSNGGSRMLVDGGRKQSFRDHTAGDLGDSNLDLIVVSHIDNDHISGIVDLFDEAAAWKRYEIHADRLEEKRAELEAEGKLVKAEREVRKLKPKSAKPPAVKEVWHNSFKDQVNHSSEVPFAQSQIDDFLVTAMRMQLLDTRFEEDLEETANIAQGVKEAVILRNRLSKEQLRIPVNSPAQKDSTQKGSLLFLGDDTGKGSVPTTALECGEFSVRILGPSRGDLVRLEELWRKWIKDNEDVAAELRREAQIESERLDAGQPIEFGSVLSSLARRLGDGSTITPPNLASLLLLVEAEEKSLLLTGDGLASEVLRGLRLHGLLANEEQAGDQGPGHANGGPPTFHVDMLKVPHHGASDNIDADGFFSLVTADHYLFCGNGSHHNPEKDVVELVIAARDALVGDLGEYHLWFSSSEEAANTSTRRKHMKMIETLVNDIGGPGCNAHFLRKWTEGEDRESRSFATIDL